MNALTEKGIVHIYQVDVGVCIGALLNDFVVVIQNFQAIWPVGKAGVFDVARTICRITNFARKIWHPPGANGENTSADGKFTHKKFPVSALAALQRQEGMPVKVTSLRGFIHLKGENKQETREVGAGFISFPL